VPLTFWFKKVRVIVARLSGRALLALVAFHYLSSWLGMIWIGEEKILSITSWTYYYVTTAITVGYGDLSPSTDAGRWFASLWLMPGSVALFAALIGKITQVTVELWRNGMLGKDNFHNLVDHTLILGWHGEQTEKMVELLRQDPITGQKPIVLCAIQEMENPLPDQVLFVRGESFAHPALLQRAGVAGAQRILLYAHNDEQALATALAVLTQHPTGHLVVHFRDEEAAKVLRHHHPEVEVTCSLSIEVLVRAAQDPGSSLVTQELLSVLEGPTQYSMECPIDIPFTDIFHQAKKHFNLILLGYRLPSKKLVLNPEPQVIVPQGAWIYYIGNQRMTSQDWHQLFQPSTTRS
jgi:voltage-gated potassium channel